MDKFLVEKYRTLGIVALIVTLSLTLLSSFLTLKTKKDFGFKSKMFYSDMMQSIQYSINNNDLPSQWALHVDGLNQVSIKENVLNTIRVSKDCLDLQKGCFYDGYYKNLANKLTAKKFGNKPSVLLSNGVSVAFEPSGDCRLEDDSCLLMYVDLNNLEPPNTIGKDLIVFELTNKQTGYLKPFGLNLGFGEILNNSKFGCSKKSSEPLYCSSLLFSKNWQYDKRYPW